MLYSEKLGGAFGAKNKQNFETSLGVIYLLADFTDNTSTLSVLFFVLL